MSVESMAIALHHSRAKGSAKLICVGIANHDGDGGAMPSMRTLAKYGGVEVRQARKAVRRLEELGEIRTDIQGGTLDYLDDDEQPNRYHFLLTCPVWCDKTKHHRDTRKGWRGPNEPLWKTPRSSRTGGVPEDRGSPVPQNRQTRPSDQPPPGSASATGQARTRDTTPPCRECSAPNLSTCIARQARVAKADRHDYQPRERTTTP